MLSIEFCDVDHGLCFLNVAVCGTDALLEYDGRTVRPAQHVPPSELANTLARTISPELAGFLCRTIDPDAVADAFGERQTG